MKAASKNVKGVKVDFVWDKCALFLSSFDPRQMRYLGLELAAIVDSVAFYARRAQQVGLPSSDCST